MNQSTFMYIWILLHLWTISLFLISNSIQELLDPFVFSNKFQFIQVNFKESVDKNSSCLIHLMYIVRFTKDENLWMSNFYLNKQRNLRCCSHYSLQLGSLETWVKDWGIDWSMGRAGKNLKSKFTFRFCPQPALNKYFLLENVGKRLPSYRWTIQHYCTNQIWSCGFFSLESVGATMNYHSSKNSVESLKLWRR